MKPITGTVEPVIGRLCWDWKLHPFLHFSQLKTTLFWENLTLKTHILSFSFPHNTLSHSQLSFPLNFFFSLTLSHLLCLALKFGGCLFDFFPHTPQPQPPFSLSLAVFWADERASKDKNWRTINLFPSSILAKEKKFREKATLICCKRNDILGTC